MTTTTKAPTAPVPGFHAPWTGIAKAYAVARTFDAAHAGFKRKRKSQMFKMDNNFEAGDIKCEACNIKLRNPYAANPGGTRNQQDKQSTWTYLPASKTIVGGMHYYCSWGNLMTRIYKLAH